MSAFVTLQKVLPKKLLTELAGRLAECRWRPFKNLLIRLFCHYYQVDLAHANIKDASGYVSFNDFFTRALEPEARPIDSALNTMVSPADGAVSAFGSLQRHLLVQAKDILYSVDELVVDEVLADKLESGHFITIYLSPKDYHRVHVPLAGKLIGVTYVPGKLFSVNNETARLVDGLFSRNERIVAQFQTPDFTYALVMVGAMIVGGMETTATGRIHRSRQSVELNESVGKQYNKGEEFGRFHLGSTVILVLPKEADIRFTDKLSEGAALNMGTALAALGQLESESL